MLYRGREWGRVKKRGKENGKGRVRKGNGKGEDIGEYVHSWLQKTQPTRRGDVTVVWQTLCKLCLALLPPEMRTRLPYFWGKPAMQTRWMAGNAPHKTGDVETNLGPTTTCKQVWISNICHIQIQVRKQISRRCNRIEHWVHL